MIPERRNHSSRRRVRSNSPHWVRISRALAWVGLLFFIASIIGGGAPIWVLGLSACALWWCYRRGPRHGTHIIG